MEIDALMYRVKHAESQVERQEKLCRDIQQELVVLDTSWERKLLRWEELQVCIILFLIMSEGFF